MLPGLDDKRLSERTRSTSVEVQVDRVGGQASLHSPVSAPKKIVGLHSAPTPYWEINNQRLERETGKGLNLWGSGGLFQDCSIGIFPIFWGVEEKKDYRPSVPV